MNDPSPDLYKILDQVGLDATTFLATRKPMSQIVNHMRTELVVKLKEYIESREPEEPKF